MNLKIRAVDLDRDRGELLSVLQRNLVDLPHARRFDWLYRNGPAGTAWSWLAYEPGSERVVGVASVFPRVMCLGGKTALCGQVGDFAVDRSHRSLGPAVMLQRATFAPVDGGALAFCYDCPPHDRGLSTFRRLGMGPQVQMERYARLLRVDRQVERRLGRGPVASTLAAVGNALVAWRRVGGRAASGIETSVYNGRFDEEFSWLDRQVGGDDVIRSRRTAEELNWRYRDDPLREYRVVVARRRCELVAYAVFYTTGADAYIAEVSGHVSVEIGVALIETIVQALEGSPVQTVQAVVAGGSPLSAVLRPAGFRFRAGGAAVVAYARAGSEARALLERGPTWAFSHSDVVA